MVLLAHDAFVRTNRHAVRLGRAWCIVIIRCMLARI